MEFTYRRATPADRDFLIHAITEAEKGPAGLITYCALFSITEDEFRTFVGNVLDENIEGQEMCCSNFIIAETDGEPAGTLGTFIEMKEGLSSGVIKMNLLMHFLDREKVLAARDNLAIMNEVNIPREPNSLQVEYLYVKKKFGGTGLMWSLLDEHIREAKENNWSCTKLSAIMPVNRKITELYCARYGFTTVTTLRSTNPKIIDFIACDGKQLMEMPLGG